MSTNETKSVYRNQFVILSVVINCYQFIESPNLIDRYLELLWYGLESRSANKRSQKRQERDWQQINALSTLHRNNLSEGQTPAQVCTHIQTLIVFETGFWRITTFLSLQITNEPEIDYYILMIHSDRDTALLSLLKSFIQCAPQMVLQIYLLVRHSPNFNTTLGIHKSLSLYPPSLSLTHSF